MILYSSAGWLSQSRTLLECRNTVDTVEITGKHARTLKPSLKIISSFDVVLNAVQLRPPTLNSLKPKQLRPSAGFHRKG